MTNPMPGCDVNEAFAAERATQLREAAAQQADVEAQVAAGTLIPLGGGRYRINQPGSLDDGEVWTLRDGQVLPQHGLDQSGGRIALYTATPAWHCLGTVIPGGTTDLTTVLEAGGIDYLVTRRPVRYQPDLTDPRSPTQVLPDRYVTVREDTGAGLGVVGARYEIVQNIDIFAFLQDLVDRYDVTWESAGALRDGRRVFVSLRLPDTVTIDANGINDQIVPYIAAVNSHDGSTQAHIVATPWRIVCGNTERFALRDAATRWGVRHTRNWNSQQRIAAARRTLRLSIAYFDTFAAEEAALARTELALAEYHALIDQLWPPPDPQAPQRVRTNHVTRTETLVDLYHANSDRLGTTAYAAERAITEYADWKTGVRPTGSLRGNNLAARATAVLEGTHDALKTRAHRQLLTLTRR